MKDLLVQKGAIVSWFRQEKRKGMWSVLGRQMWPLCLAKGFTFLFTFLAFVISARYLGREIFGVYVLAYSLPQLALPLLDFGFSAIVTRESAKGSVVPWYWGGVLASVTLAPIISGIILAASYLLGMGEKDLLLMGVGAGQLLFMSLRPLEAKLIAEKRTLELGVYSLLANCLAFVAVAGAVLAKATAYVILGAHISYLAIYYGLVVIAVVRDLHNSKSPGIKRLLRESWPYGLGNTYATITERSGTVVVFVINGALAAGAFGVGFRFYELIGGVASVVMTVIFPHLSELTQRSGELREHLRRLMRVALALSGCLALWLAGLSSQMVEAIFGNEYQEATVILLFLSPAVVNILPGSLVAYAVIALGNSRGYLRGAAWGAVISVAGGLFLAYALGPVGPCISLAVGGIAVMASLLRELPEEMKKDIMLIYGYWYKVWLAAFSLVLASYLTTSMWAMVTSGLLLGVVYTWCLMVRKKGAYHGSLSDVRHPAL